MSTRTQSRPDALNTESTAPESMTVSSALAQMLEQLPDGILLLDEQWRITFANRTACAISRLLPEHFHGPTHWEIFPETVGTPLQTAYNDVMQKRTERRVPSFFYAPFSVWLDVRVRCHRAAQQ
jgi:PAS domain-containing protein